MDIKTTALKVTTPYGSFYAVFPDDAPFDQVKA